MIESLDNFQTNYLDLVLIHWPGVKGLKLDDEKNALIRRETWNVLEEYYSNGKVKSIGVSNYTIKHLNELFSYSKIRPHLLQVKKFLFLLNGSTLI